MTLNNDNLFAEMEWLQTGTLAVQLIIQWGEEEMRAEAAADDVTSRRLI